MKPTPRQDLVSSLMIWKEPTHIIRSRVRKDIVQRVCFGNVAGWFADDDCEFDLIVWEIVLWWLGNAW